MNFPRQAYDNPFKNDERISSKMNHEPDCAGGHLESISCTEVARLRAAAAANPWYCHGATRSGYHLFDTEEPDEQCNYEGCNRTWRELMEAAT